MWSRIELVLSLVVIGLASRYLVHFVHSMATTSLWNDELYSATRFSGRGPIHTLTSYGEANNHIFFNLLNSVTPGAGSIEPFRARLWSFVAVGATAGLLLWEFFRRKWFLPGAVLFFLFAANYRWLDLALQARGYGILGLCALVSCVALWRYLEEPQTKWLTALALATLVGTWTIPTYIIWAGPLWLLFLLTVRQARVLRFGAGAFGAIAVVYLPVAGQVRREMAGYAKEWGRHYTGLNNICATFKSFLFHPQVFFGHSFSNLAVVLIVVGVLLGAQFLAIPNELRRLTLILIGATMVFFAIAVRLGTIVPRTTAFVMVPFAFAMVITVTAVLRKVPSGTFRPAVAVAVGLALSIHSIQVADTLHFVPIANWRDAATYIGHTFPEGSAIAGPHDVNGWRTTYLDPSYHAASGSSPYSRAQGWTVLDDVNRPGHPAFDMRAVVPVFSEIRVPQRRGGFLRVFGVPPAEASVDRVFVDGALQPLGPLTDHRPDTGDAGLRRPSRSTTVRVDPVQRVVSRSLTLLGRRALPRVVRVDVTLAGGATIRQPQSSITETGSTLSIALDDRHVQSIAVTFAPTGRATPLTLSELWVYPAAQPQCSSRGTTPDGCTTSKHQVGVRQRVVTMTR